MRQIEAPTDEVQPNPANPRPEPPESELRPLGESLLVQQLVPIIVDPAMVLYDGFRRWLAAKLVGKRTLTANVIDKGMSASDVILVTDMHKVGLTDFERACACAGWLKENPGATAKDLAGKIKRDASLISKVLSLWKCVPAVIEAAKAERVGLCAWTAISKADEKTQHEMLAFALQGNGRDELERKGRKARNGLNEPKFQRVRIPYGAGDVTVTGKEMDVASVREVLEGVMRELRKAEGTYDLKTVCSMQRQKHKGGVA